MNGYSNLAAVTTSPPPMANGGRARRSLELTNTKETNAWEGLAIGAVTLARTFSTGSQRLSARSGEKSTARNGGAGAGLPGAVRRALSMRRHPAAPGKGDGYYWRIHDMDGDSDNAAEEHEADGEKKAEQQRREGGEKEEEATKERTKKINKKKGSNILRACKKILRL